MARLINRLSPNAAKALRKSGRHADGGGLFLSISPNGGRRWTFIYRWRGKKTELGFGSARDVTLAKARQRATVARDNLAAGLNPRDAINQAKGATFGEVAEQLIAAMRPSWKNDKHAAQWTMTLLGRTPADEPTKIDYCADLRRLPVAGVTTSDVLAVLQPLWQRAPETASRLRGRIERVWAAAKAKGHCSGENPARWSDNLKELLPARSKMGKIKHHPALPYADLPAFVKDLRGQEGIAARALEYTILTVARTNETIGASWDEIDIREKVWTVPAARMKAETDHRVPLSNRAIAALDAMKAARDGSGFVFPGGKVRQPLSNMAMLALIERMNDRRTTAGQSRWTDPKQGNRDVVPHGFRSTFRDWAAEETNFPNHVVEMALAHAIDDETEAAYRRGDLFDKRRELMTAWAAFCFGV